MTSPGIYIVGAGPGDPLLLTRKAARLIAAADVVVLDRHSLDGVATMAPPAAERCYVGRTTVGPGWETDRIVDLLTDRAAAGLAVVRLKGGDPFVCSRGAEEWLALLARGVACEVVPGVSAATAAPLAAGVARGRAVTIAAGNNDPCYPDLDFATLVDPRGSLVLMTGRSRQAEIAAAVMAGGLEPTTPAHVVSAATRPQQRMSVTTVVDLGSCHLPPPATIVIGPDLARGFRAHS